MIEQRSEGRTGESTRHFGQAAVPLSAVDVASFVTYGFLRLDSAVPSEVNDAVSEEVSERIREYGPNPRDVELSFQRQYYASGTPIWDCFDVEGSLRSVGQMLRTPKVRGAIQSLVGPEPTYDHHAVHLRQPGLPSQSLHADSVIDTRVAFDILLMYYPSGCTAEGGGTMIVPGTHLRQINGGDIGRYQNVRGQTYIDCRPGTVFVLHHGLWHSGRRNRTEHVRTMVKLRLNPTIDQVGIIQGPELDDPAVQEQIRDLFEVAFPWQDEQVSRLQRAALFRRLSGRPDFKEAEPWLDRIRNRPVPNLRELVG
jgi:hypothetical protein